jgi:trans-aconitate 2-methyltransferase
VNIPDYYDDFSQDQLRTGINDRHRAIHKWLKRFGLARDMNVLEIGCGIGTETELIAGTLNGSGILLAIDVSPASIAIARERLAKWPNVKFLVGDAVELELDRQFDIVVMPDVLEHIPVERHVRLFANIRRWLKDTGWALVHMPNPFFLKWCQENRPDLLQLVDQPIFTEMLLASIAPNELYVHHLETYSIWVPEGDYQVVVLKPRIEGQRFHLAQAPPSVRTRITRLARRALHMRHATERKPLRRSE